MFLMCKYVPIPVSQVEFAFLYSQNKSVICVSKSQESRKKKLKQTNTEIVKIKPIYFIIIIEDQRTVKPHSNDNTKKVQRRAC